jgi:hypothetical protein
VRTRTWQAAILIAVGMAACASPPQDPSIDLEAGAFRLSGWPPPPAAPAGGWASVFAVYAGPGDIPPLLGEYAREGGALVFRPRFPFEPGVRYRAVFTPSGAGVVLERTFDVLEAATTPEARVTAVYPTSDVLPSNQLRLYVYFSAPMSRGEYERRVRVLDADGAEMPGVFLPAEELWDPDNRRLTLTYDPGRIKRGLTANEALGPPIVEGEAYTLVIDRAWPDARGVPMVEAYRKPYRGGPAVRTQPRPAEWAVAPPMAGTTGSLVVTFPVPMNYPLLQRMLQVRDAEGPVAGAVTIAAGETEWRFTPDAAWTAGPHRLVADTSLEDLAGNSIAQPFDIDVFDRVTERIETGAVEVPFTVR